MIENKIICKKSDLTSVADTIRSKLGVTDTYYVSELSSVISDELTKKLPTLTNPGTASDLLFGKELIDQDGNKVTGTHQGGSTPTLQSKSVTYTSNGTATVTPDSGYDGLSSVDVTVNVSGGGGETAENVVITSSLPSYLNKYIQICGIDKDGNKILLNGYTTPVSVKKNTPLMIRIAEYPYARISGKYTGIGVYSSNGRGIIGSTEIASGDSRVSLIVPTGDLNIYDAD